MKLFIPILSLLLGVILSTDQSGFEKASYDICDHLPTLQKGLNHVKEQCYTGINIIQSYLPSGSRKKATQVINVSNQNIAPLIQTATNYYGTPYVYGGTKRSGIDCSGFVQAVFKSHGIFLPRTARAQYRTLQDHAVSDHDRASGDVVYFRDPRSRRIVHCGILINRDFFIHASQGHRRVVITSLLNPYYKRRIAGYRKLL